MEGPQIRENGRAKEDSPKILARAHMSVSLVRLTGGTSLTWTLTS